ncbi:N-acetylglucosamine kinase [Pinibacter aurantiacus]|uniref:N-acetylglucosamine kinase n=1 Tax=Pinibacter aurantiacus TaxID=2851599 RepID=A0A9E2W8Q8_9BACT|nr:N-acetylglucosamine kinase [Pinibacter aurantiacus]MBV4358532.1 N-acetylglucosamine kinase [Pinibacter aurantiacus]
MALLIADSGSTKCEWCVVDGKKTKRVFTTGISPYFLNGDEIKALIEKELVGKLKNVSIEEIFYYGTGCKNPDNRKMVKKALQKVFTEAEINVDHDLNGAAKGLCGDKKGVACILGTGSSSSFYNGSKIIKERTGLGYILGDEGSGAYLGKNVVQYYLYGTFDEELKYRFEEKFGVSEADMLTNVYKGEFPNRYLASFAVFLAENRGHFMIENIIEDGLNDFFFHHICKFTESWNNPINFVGSIAYGFKDVITELCHSYEFEMGNILKNPMDGLIKYHSK